MSHSITFANLDVTVIKPNELALRMQESATGPTGLRIHFVNSYNIALSARNQEYREVLSSADMLVPDGRWLSLLLSYIGSRQVQQVRGPDFFKRSMSEEGFLPTKQYLLGGTAQTLKDIERQAREHNPTVDIVGATSPPFRDLSAAELEVQDAEIKASAASLVWIGLGTPRQDYEAARLVERLPITVACVGAAFDFYSGCKREAPRLVQRAGLEWLFRLMTEPRRLIWRYVFANSLFIVLAVRELWRRK